MNTKYKNIPGDGERIVYVKQVDVSDLPLDLQEEADGLTQLFAVHNAHGERLALVRDKGLAFSLAKQNDLAPVNVH